MARTYRVTPTLLIGRVPVGNARAVRAHSVQEAVAAIEDGMVAVLPTEAWDLAERVLEALGMPRQAAQDHIGFSDPAHG